MAAEGVKIYAAIWLTPGPDVVDRKAWLFDPTREFEALPWSAVTSCGKRVRFDKLDDVPLEDQPHNCGDPTCFVVKWEPRTA